MKIFDMIVKILMLGGCVGLFFGAFFVFELLFKANLCH